MVLMFLVLGISLPVMAGEKAIDIYKSENCGCCSLWGKAMEKTGFKVQARVMNDQVPSALKEKHTVPVGLRSCHTVVVGNLIIESHAPATAVYKVVQSGSGIYGLATPGTSTGGSGMEMGARKEAYDAITFSPDGGRRVFQRIEQSAEWLITGRR